MVGGVPGSKVAVGQTEVEPVGKEKQKESDYLLRGRPLLCCARQGHEKPKTQSGNKLHKSRYNGGNESACRSSHCASGSQPLQPCCQRGTVLELSLPVHAGPQSAAAKTRGTTSLTDIYLHQPMLQALNLECP